MSPSLTADFSESVDAKSLLHDVSIEMRQLGQEFLAQSVERLHDTIETVDILRQAVLADAFKAVENYELKIRCLNFVVQRYNLCEPIPLSL